MLNIQMELIDLTQEETVLRHLKNNEGLTSYESFALYGITRLSAVIFRIKNDLGIEITGKRIKKTNRNGRKVRYKKYMLKV